MAYDDLKTHRGASYSGMRIGSAHQWHYPDGRWQETKQAPDAWDFTFAARKVRQRAAPTGSGAQPGTRYHWLILAHQWVRKVDANAYETYMQGIKSKIAHQRPHWRQWSAQYPDQERERERVIQVLEATLGRLRAQQGASARLSETDPGGPPARI